MIESVMFSFRFDPSILPCLLVIISVVVSVFSGLLLWRIDQHVLDCKTSWRAIVSIALAIFALWVTILMHLSIFLKVPGAYGPVQFWAYSDDVDFMSGPRVLAMYSIFAGYFLCILTAILTLVSLFINPLKRRWYRTIVPIISLVIFGLTLFWMDHYMFFPSA